MSETMNDGVIDLNRPNDLPNASNYENFDIDEE